MSDVQKIVYTCPMHPEVKREHPGICSECGMNLVQAQNEKRKAQNAAVSLDKHAGHSTRVFFRKFWVSLILTVPVVLYADIVEAVFNWSPPLFYFGDFELGVIVSLLFGSVVFFYGGGVFLLGALRELRARLPGMMTLIGVAISAAYFFSLYATFAGEEALFWELTTLITIMLFGHFLEMRAVSGAQGALRELSKLLPDTVEKFKISDLQFKNDKNTQQETEIVPLGELREGDVVFVRPGGRIPSDGVVLDGASEVDESMMTGESAPIMKHSSSAVIAGSLNGSGSLTVKVERIGARTFLAGVMRLVEEAQASKSRLQILSDRAAFYLTLIAVIGSAAAFFSWIVADAGFGFAVKRLVAVLVIACPHALGLAVPLVASISTTRAARSGFLVRQRLALEAARNIDVVLFDKTGTLTKGEYGVTDVWPLEGYTEKELLALAASIDAHSEHFISKAIVSRAKEAGAELFSVQNFSRIAGKGVMGVIKGEEIFVGGEALRADLNFTLPDNLSGIIDQENRKGKTIIYVANKQILLGVFALADLLREESKEAIAGLRNLGVKVVMITGDSEGVAHWVAEELGIDEYFARVLPQEKSSKVKLLQEKGFQVAMVGDGINDAPALTEADVGIAIGAGTNVAVESAGIILVKNDPRDIVKIVKLSRMTYSKMIQNLFWATGYNVVALPLASGVLAYKGLLLEPALAALFMSASTVIVAINAILLKLKKL